MRLDNDFKADRFGPAASAAYRVPHRWGGSATLSVTSYRRRASWWCSQLALTAQELQVNIAHFRKLFW